MRRPKLRIFVRAGEPLAEPSGFDDRRQSLVNVLQLGGGYCRNDGEGLETPVALVPALHSAANDSGEPFDGVRK